MPLLAKFKQTSLGFRATLKFSKIYGGSENNGLKLKLRVLLAGYNVSMVTYYVKKMIPTCSPVIGQFCDTMIVA